MSEKRFVFWYLNSIWKLFENSWKHFSKFEFENGAALAEWAMEIDEDIKLESNTGYQTFDNEEEVNNTSDNTTSDNATSDNNMIA